MWTYGASKNLGGHFSGKKSACGNVPRSSGLPKIWGPFFWEKKSACGNVPTSSGLPKIGTKFLKIFFTHEKMEANSWKYFSPMKNWRQVLKKYVWYQTVQKIKILKIKIRSAQNVGKVWISRKKILMARFGLIWAIFFAWAGKMQKNNIFSLFSLVGPWAHQGK